MRLTQSQMALRNRLRGRVDGFENADGDLPMQSSGASAVIQASAGQASFDAQFDIQILVRYFSVAVGVFTARSAAYMLANAADVCTTAALGFFLFGNIDFSGGYKKARASAPLTNWAYNNPFTFGNGYPSTQYGVLDATAQAVLQVGDVVIPHYVSNGGVTYVALVIVRCTNVAYATLLAASNSDSFVLNKVRYIQNDTSAAGLAQYANAINWIKLSLFGKADTDSITPNSQKQPNQFQAGIVDVDILKAITKEIAFWSYINYDATDLQWSIYVKTINKLPSSL